MSFNVAFTANSTTRQIPQSNSRGPKRCSCCRLVGHNVRNCPSIAGERDDLFNRVISKITRRVPEITSYPLIFTSARAAIREYIWSLTGREVLQGFEPGSPVINRCYSLVTTILTEYEEYYIAIEAPLLGKNYAKEIALNVVCASEDSECFICCSEKCSVKTGCGHEFCASCIIRIIDTNNEKTSAPFCSFCKTPITELTSSNVETNQTLYNYIQNI